MHNRQHHPHRSLKKLSLVQLPIGDGEIDEAKEGIEGGAEEREEITHGGDYLCENEADEPDYGHDCCPDAPAEDGVAVCVAGFTHHTEVNEFGTDVCVDGADNDGRDDDEGEGGFSVNDGAEGTEGRGGGVLTQVAETDCRWDDEEEC